MGNVNIGRVLLGGLVAGLIMNIGEYVLNEIVLAEQMSASFEAMNLTPPGGATIGLFVCLTFAVGIATIWLYAMLRSHSGPGPKTAVCAAILAWFFMGFVCNTWFWALGMASAGMTITAYVWMLVEMVVATLAGARLYQD